MNTIVNNMIRYVKKKIKTIAMVLIIAIVVLSILITTTPQITIASYGKIGITVNGGSVLNVGGDLQYDGDKVFVDDTNAYISATPHTLSSSGWVEFELQSKNYSGLVDVAWGFPSEWNVSKPQIYRPVAHNATRTVTPYEVEDTITCVNVISYQTLPWGSYADIGNTAVGTKNNKRIELTIQSTSVVNDYQPVTTIVAYRSYTVDGNSVTFTYYKLLGEESYVDTYPDWEAIPSAVFQHASYSVLGCSDWYIVQVDNPITAGTTYKVRCWVNVPFKGFDVVSGKYNFAIKPRSETIQQAYISGHLYVLDPWYNASWLKRKQITINGTADGAQATYQMQMTFYKSTGTDNATACYLGANVQDDFDDLRFTTSDGETLIYHWRETYTSGTSAVVWIEFVSIPTSPDTITFYVYYDNSGASSVSDGDNTFIFFDHFDDGFPTSKWSGNTSYASASSSILTITGFTSSTDKEIYGNTAMGGNAAIRTRTYYVGASGKATWNGFMYRSGATRHMSRMLINSTGGQAYDTEDDVGYSSVVSNYTKTAYQTYDIYLRQNTNARWFYGGTEAQNSPKTTNPLDNTNASYALGIWTNGAYDVQYVDWVLIRKYTLNEPIWGTWGEEEENTVPNIDVQPASKDFGEVDPNTTFWSSGSEPTWTGSSNNSTQNATASSGGWIDMTNAYADGGGYAYIESGSPSANATYGDYGFTGLTDDITSVKVRYDAWTEGTTGNSTEVQYPDNYVTQTNLDGTVGDIDEDANDPDANWADAIDDSLDIVAHVSFPTPTGNPTIGADVQNFKVYARRSTSDATPTLRVDLYENGGLVTGSILTATNVTSDSGQLFTANWNADDLATADGSLVECYIFGDATGAGASYEDPTGYNDPSGTWSDEALAYDNNTGTYAYTSVPKGDWSGYLELTFDATSTDTVRGWFNEGLANISDFELDVYYSGSWTNIYNVEPTYGQYVEFPIGSTQSVTGVRFRFYSTKADGTGGLAYEVDLVVAGSASSVDIGAVEWNVTYDTSPVYDEKIELKVTWDGGSTWSSLASQTLTSSEATYWYDVTGETTWTADKLSNSNFKVYAHALTVGDASDVYLDWMPVEVLWTSTPVLLDEDCYFELSNNGTSSVNVTVKSFNFTSAGNSWNITSDTPSLNTVRLSTYKSGDNSSAGLILTTGDQTFINGLVSSGTIKWELKLETGTFDDTESNNTTIRFTAVLAS